MNDNLDVVSPIIFVYSFVLSRRQFGRVCNDLRARQRPIPASGFRHTRSLCALAMTILQNLVQSLDCCGSSPKAQAPLIAKSMIHQVGEGGGGRERLGPVFLRFSSSRVDFFPVLPLLSGLRTHLFHPIQSRFFWSHGFTFPPWFLSC